MCGPNAIDTDHALTVQADTLSAVYAVQSEALHTALSYDCTDFGQKNYCVTGGVHYGSVPGSAEASSVLLSGAYKINPSLSVGAYLNQVISSSTVTGAVMNNNSPLFSVFGDWAQSGGDTGLKAHVAGGYNQTNLKLTRTAISTGFFFSEPGYGHADLNTYGSGVVTYGVPLNEGWLATPYAGLEYTNITRDAYTEQTSTSVTDPLTFNKLVDGATTAVGGVSVKKKFTPRLTLNASAGAEFDLARDAGTDAATSTLGSTTARFDADARRFRGTASFGGAFETLPNQAIVAGVTYREESFDGVNTVGVTAAYQIGF